MVYRQSRIFAFVVFGGVGRAAVGFSVLVTGEVSRVRLCRDHGEIFFWLSLLRALVWVVYDAGSPGRLQRWRWVLRPDTN